jgi:hypothetical protein
LPVSCRSGGMSRLQGLYECLPTPSAYRCFSVETSPLGLEQDNLFVRCGACDRICMLRLSCTKKFSASIVS